MKLKQRAERFARIGRLSSQMHEVGRIRLTALEREQAELSDDLRAVFEALECGGLAAGAEFISAPAASAPGDRPDPLSKESARSGGPPSRTGCGPGSPGRPPIGRQGSRGARGAQGTRRACRADAARVRRRKPQVSGARQDRPVRPRSGLKLHAMREGRPSRPRAGTAAAIEGLRDGCLAWGSIRLPTSFSMC